MFLERSACKLHQFNSILYCQPPLKLLNIKYMALVWELPNMKYLNNNYSLTIRDNYMTVSLLSNSRAVKLWINGIYLNQVHRVNLDTLMKNPNIILRVVLSTRIYKWIFFFQALATLIWCLVCFIDNDMYPDPYQYSNTNYISADQFGIYTSFWVYSLVHFHLWASLLRFYMHTSAIMWL